MSLAMTKAERELFLSELHVGIVSIPRQGRGPLTVPIWYDYSPGGEVWMITGSTSLKAVDRISLCVQNETAPYSYVSIEGPFTTRPTSDKDLLHMAIRYLGDDLGKQYAEAGVDDESMIVSIAPENWLTVDYGKR